MCEDLSSGYFLIYDCNREEDASDCPSCTGSTPHSKLNYSYKRRDLVSYSGIICWPVRGNFRADERPSDYVGRIFLMQRDMCLCRRLHNEADSRFLRLKSQVHLPRSLRVFLLMGPVTDAIDAPQPWRLNVQPCNKDEVFPLFHFNRAQVEWNWQGKTEVLGENPVPLPLCPRKIAYDPGFFFLSRYFPLIHFVPLNPSLLLHVTYVPY